MIPKGDTLVGEGVESLKKRGRPPTGPLKSAPVFKV